MGHTDQGELPPLCLHSDNPFQTHTFFTPLLKPPPTAGLYNQLHSQKRVYRWQQFETHHSRCVTQEGIGSNMAANSLQANALAAKSKRSKSEQSIDGCRDADNAQASLPLRGRLDVPARHVVVTLRLGGTMLLQRISLNDYAGVAAHLDTDQETPDQSSVRLVLRHEDPAYSITLDKDLPIEEAVAVWRGWADKLSVPLLLRDETGEDAIVRDMLGPVILRTTQPRRARSLVGRRPRFSKRLGRR